MREFSNDEDASAFINEKWKEKNLLFTWAPLTGYKYNEKAPVRIPLSDEEIKMKKDLRDSFTIESIKEWGRMEMNSKIYKDYWGHPSAKGYEDKK